MGCTFGQTGQTDAGTRLTRRVRPSAELQIDVGRDGAPRRPGGSIVSDLRTPTARLPARLWRVPTPNAIHAPNRRGAPSALDPARRCEEANHQRGLSWADEATSVWPVGRETLHLRIVASFGGGLGEAAGPQPPGGLIGRALWPRAPVSGSESSITPICRCPPWGWTDFFSATGGQVGYRMFALRRNP